MEPVKPRETMTTGIFGRRRILANLNKLETAFLVIGLISLVACSGLTIERLDYLSPANCPRVIPGQNVSNASDQQADREKCGAEFTFALLILINCIFCLFHVFHGVIWERPYELYIFIASVTIVTFYCIVDFVVVIHQEFRTDGYPFAIKLMRLVILLTVGLVDVILAYLVAQDFLFHGHHVYGVVGGDTDDQRKCKVHFFTESLFTFDLEFQVTLVVVILRHGFEFGVTEGELGVLIGGLIFATIWMVCANVCIRLDNKLLTPSENEPLRRSENEPSTRLTPFTQLTRLERLTPFRRLTPLTRFVLATSVFEPAYIVYKMVDSAHILKYKDADETSLSLHYCVFIGGSLGLLIRLILVAALWTTTSYDGDIKKKIYGSKFSFFTLENDSGTNAPPEHNMRDIQRDGCP